MRDPSSPRASADDSALPGEIAGLLDVYRHALHLAEREVVLEAAVWFHTGAAYRAAGQVDGAMACFKKVIAVDPNEHLAY